MIAVTKVGLPVHELDKKSNKLALFPIINLCIRNTSKLACTKAS